MRNQLWRLSLIWIIILCLTGCIGSTPTTVVTPFPTPKPQLPKAVVSFEVKIPPQTPQGQSIFLDILDEVTGLALNPSRYTLDRKDNTTYTIRLPLTAGAVIKYRYGREAGNLAVEHTSQARQVRYRLIYVTGNMSVNDIVAAWSDVSFQGEKGRVKGQVLSQSGNTPIPNILIACGGFQTITASDGSFLLDGLPVGTHLLVAYAMDGSYQIYQQGAVVGNQTTTPAPIQLKAAAMTKVTFIAHSPKTSVTGMPIRLIGNIYSLGNTFADLNGGFSTLAARAPLMSLQPDGTYSLTMQLPVGYYLQYKYTLGDGFWNAEHDSDGKFVARELIVADKEIIIEDIIETWVIRDSGSVTFTVKAPDTTPVNDSVSIQFNPFSWTEPIPMWPIGKNQWIYVLYNPMNLLGEVGYRYCRNDQCGVADDNATKGNQSQGFPFRSTHLVQSFQDEIKAWAYWSGNDKTTVVADQITPRGAKFMAGFELQPNYAPRWQSMFPQAFQNIADSGGNTVVLTPTWTVLQANNPLFESIPGSDILWPDVIQAARWSQQANLSLVIYPQLDFGTNSEAFWNSAKRDAGWWEAWFERYRIFLLNFADLATQVNASALVINQPALAPALPEGKLPNGNTSGVPANAEQRWKALIGEIRARFNGKVAWAVSSADLKLSPVLAKETDFLYVLTSPALSKISNASPADLLKEANNWMDGPLMDFRKATNKSIVLALQYASVDGASNGCVLTGPTNCLTFSSLDQPWGDKAEIKLDLQEQADIYSAFLNAINKHTWIDGVISQGYYPPAVLKDKSSSVHGKPAADVLWYWFPRLIGKLE